MYERFYGLEERPFELTSDPRYLFYTEGHQEGLSNLQYGLSGAKAVTVLIGEAGTGKTTLLQAALESEPCRSVRCVYLNNPALTRAEFIQSLATQFHLSTAASTSKAVLLAELERALREQIQQGFTTALVIDEAHALSLKLLEEVRLLANIETRARKLLPLVLAGQPELSDRLNEPALRQLKQRVALRCQLSPFTLTETAAYIASRIRTAGGEPTKLFSRQAVTLIHQHARGIPRTINVLCDNALLGGMALDRRPVGSDIVGEVVRDFDLQHGIGLASERPVVTAPVQVAPVPAPPAVVVRPRQVEVAPRSMTPIEPSISAPIEPQPRVAESFDADPEERPSLRLEDLDAQLSGPSTPPVPQPPQPEPVAVAPRRSFASRFLRRR